LYPILKDLERRDRHWSFLEKFFKNL